jgi:hypothetical protein
MTYPAQPQAEPSAQRHPASDAPATATPAGSASQYAGGSESATGGAAQDGYAERDERLYRYSGDDAAGADQSTTADRTQLATDQPGDPTATSTDQPAAGDRAATVGHQRVADDQIAIPADQPSTADQTATSANQPTTEQPGETQGELSPGDVSHDPVAALWGTQDIDRFRDEWRRLQMRFVDDPHNAANEAATLVDQAVQTLTTALSSRKQELDSWRASEGDDTEVLRMALRRYRDFLDRLLGA